MQKSVEIDPPAFSRVAYLGDEMKPTGNTLQRRNRASLLLPLEVDLPGMLADLGHCLAAQWQPHFNQRDYEGGWDSIALRSQDGQSTTVFAHPDRPYLDTPLLQQCPAFQAALGAIACEKESVRLLRQDAGGEIKTHRDIGLHYSDGVFRLHIPLVTNPDVAFVVDGQRLPMQPGQCWFGDFSLPHSVINGGNTERIHLVVDCIRNAWTDDWFAAAGFDESDFEPPKMDEATRQQVLAQLREQEGEGATALIATLEAESKAYKEAEYMDRTLAFLGEVGIGWRYEEVPRDTFLPGLEVVAGVIVIDREQLRHPGDILHEAGHIALIPLEKRSLFSGNVADSLPEHGGDEVAVILWSYAASLHLGLPLEFVLHDSGYHDDADWLRAEFESGNYIGLPLLVWMGLCEDPKKARIEGRLGFPRMGRWVR